MNTFWVFLHTLSVSSPVLAAQRNFSEYADNFYKQSDVDPTALLAFLGGIIAFVLLLIYVVYRYQRYKRYIEFQDEMKSLDLDPNSEGTLAGMVKRFSMDEPVNVLFSARLFDEMASAEMMRVLGSPGSLQAKQAFIDTVYKIRVKTYHPEWLAPGEGLVPAVEAEELD